MALRRSPDPLPPLPREALARAQGIILWLARSVAPDHPLHGSLVQFYGGLASQIGANLLQADAGAIDRIRNDIRALLVAAG